jgi:DNA invertase Pin-like site-specific DNA recombinase
LKFGSKASKIPPFSDIREAEERMNGPKQKGVAIYSRVSTNAGQDPSMQTRELEEYCKRRGWEVVGAYVDVGISGAVDSRPELNRLMEDAHRRKFFAVVVWKFDRFARSVSHLLRALETFRALGIEFISLTEQVDTTTPMGKMIFTVLGSVAELERGLISERCKAGMRNARAKGKLIGRPALRKFSKHEVETIQSLRKKKESIRQLAIQHQTTQYIINRILAGQYAGS